ncbi:MAG TPA: oligosaccharide flippase family protein [archaeon]|nr:oligosaccharide flippase family protein [archaeon]
MAPSLKLLAKNSTALLGSNIAVAGMNFLFIYFTIRFLGLHEFGVYTLLLTTIGFAEQFATLGLYSVMVSELARSLGKNDIANAKSLTYNFAKVQLGVALLGCILFFLVAYLNPFGLLPDQISAIYIFGLYLILTGIQTTMLIVFEGFQRFDLDGGILTFEAVFKLLILLALAHFNFPATVTNVTWVLFFGLLFAVLLAAWPFCKLIKPWLAVQSKKNNAFREMLMQQGPYAFVTQLIKNIQQNLYPWAIKFFLGVEAVGIFAILQKIQTALMKPVAPLDSTLLPMVSGMQDPSDIRPFYERVSKYSVWLGVAIIIPFIIATPFLLKYYVGQSYPDQELTMVLLLLTLPLYALSFPLRSVLFRFREQKIITSITLVSALVLFISTAIFVTLFGLIGAGLAMFVFFLSDIVMRRPYVKKKYGIDFRFSSFVRFESEDRLLLSRIIGRIKQMLINKKGTGQ